MDLILIIKINSLYIYLYICTDYTGFINVLKLKLYIQQKVIIYIPIIYFTFTNENKIYSYQ